jgi:hypothetical protein
MKPAFLALALIASTVGLGALAQRDGFDPLRHSLPRESVQAIYAADPADPWNQVFFDLFTRTVEARLLPAGMTPFQIGASESQDKLRAARRVTRIESGDRAIDPLYSSWTWMGSSLFDMSSRGNWGVLNEPRYSHVLAALSAVQATAAAADPLRRALMQSDLWAAHDVVYAAARPFGPRSQPDAVVRQQRADILLERLRAAIRALALSRAQIAALPDTLRDAVRRGVVPDMLDEGAGWSEIRWFPERVHERAVQDRRAARVFLRPTRGQEIAALLPRLRQAHGGDLDAIDAAALVMQVLLVADDGSVVPSPLTYDVQIRQMNAGKEGSRFVQFELSRRALLGNPRRGGLVRFDEQEPAYLAIAGNDLSFATRPRMDADAVVAPLAMRCAMCHGSDGRQLMTFSVTFDNGTRRLERLNAAEGVHAREVAERKTQREDYRSLALR